MCIIPYMKRSRLFLTSLIAISLGIISCKNSGKIVQEVDVKVDDVVRKTGDFFSLDDIEVYLTFNSGKELIEPTHSLYSNLSFMLRCPEQGIVRITSNNYVLPDIGTYDVEVTYNPNSNYSFPVTGYASFDVVDRVVPATSLSLGSDSVSLFTDSSEKIDYLVQPEDCTSNVYFESNDPKVAEVSKDGVITGIGEGQCIVTTYVDEFKQECLVTVSPSEMTHLTDLENALNAALDDKWGSLRGIEVVSIALGSVTLPKEDENLIKELQRKNVYARNAAMAGATLVEAQAEAMKNAASNANGARRQKIRFRRC